MHIHIQHEQISQSHNYTLSNSIYKKHKIPHMCSMMLEIRIVGTLEGSSD